MPLLEGSETKDPHERLTDLQVVKPVDELAGTSAPPVIEPVVAVGRPAELAQPPEDQPRRRIDIHGSVQGVRTVDQSVTRVVPLSLL